MKYGVVLMLFGAVCVFKAWDAGSVWLAAVYVSAALCFVGVGVGFLWIGPRIFLKQRDGRLPVVSYLLFWPYHLLNAGCLALVGCASRESPADEIVPNLYLGRRPTAFDRRRMPQDRFAAVLDLTCEFGEGALLRAAPRYRCVPLLDTFAPTVEQLDDSVRFVADSIGTGPVFVHCALGHGRSATFVAAYLIAAGIAPDAASAERFIQARRPAARLHKNQIKALEAFTRARCTADGERRER